MEQTADNKFHILDVWDKRERTNREVLGFSKLTVKLCELFVEKELQVL